MDSTAVTQAAPAVLANERGQANMLSLMMNVDFMASIDKMAAMMASGKTTVPTHLRGNQADCFAICLQAVQWGMNPFPVAQKTHLVGGTLGYEAQLVNAVVVNSGVIKGRFDYEFFGPWERVIGKFSVIRKEKDGKPVEYRVPAWSFADEQGCGVRVRANLTSGETREIELLLQQARTRNSTLWADDPKQQLAYLAVKRWTRLHTPDVILGVYSVDELEEREVNPDFTSQTPDSTPKSATDTLAEKAAAKRAQQREAKQHVVIEGEATPVEQSESGSNAEIDMEDTLAELLYKLDIAESLSEFKQVVNNISQLTTHLTQQQKDTANEVYCRNRDRLGLGRHTS